MNVGHYADILVFDPSQIQAHATYENPHQLTTGFDWIFLNGQLVRKKEQLLEASGRVLRFAP